MKILNLLSKILFETTEKMITDECCKKFEVYKESLNTLRHYSSILSNIRTLTLIQGVIILGFSLQIYSNTLNEYYFYICLSFGAALALALWGLHQNYYNHYNRFLNQTVILERKLPVPNIWEEYRKKRKGFCNCFLHHITFIIISGTFIILILLLVFDCINLDVIKENPYSF